VKKLIKQIIRNLSAFFYRKFSRLWEEGREEVIREDFSTQVEHIGERFELAGAPTISLPRMVSLGSFVSLGRNINLEGEGGIFIADHAILEDGVVIETKKRNQQNADHDFEHPHEMFPVSIGKGAYIGKGAVIKPGTYIPPGAVVGAGEKIEEDQEIPPARTKDYPRRPIRKSHQELGKNMFFVVSTGRAGTRSIANVLSQHPDIRCRHEAQFSFNLLSTLFEEDRWDREKIKRALHTLFIQTHSLDLSSSYYGESDLKNSNLIPLIHELLPEARFIWLIRKAEDFVASAYGRGWFDDREYSYGSEKTFSPDTMITERDINPYRWQYSRHRINWGEKDGWKDMTAFERNCRYWGYWNQMIEENLSALPEEQSFQVKLEELHSRVPDLLSWLGAPQTQLNVRIFNQATHQEVGRDTWSEVQQAQFKRWCEDGMNKWYRS